MPSSSGHHHREPRARKVYGKEGGPVPPVGGQRHDYQPQERGWAGCSCGRWTRAGSRFVTELQHKQHVKEARRLAKEEEERLARARAARGRRRRSRGR